MLRRLWTRAADPAPHGILSGWLTYGGRFHQVALRTLEGYSPKSGPPSHRARLSLYGSGQACDRYVYADERLGCEFILHCAAMHHHRMPFIVRAPPLPNTPGHLIASDNIWGIGIIWIRQHLSHGQQTCLCFDWWNPKNKKTGKGSFFSTIQSKSLSSPFLFHIFFEKPFVHFFRCFDVIIEFFKSCTLGTIFREFLKFMFDIWIPAISLVSCLCHSWLPIVLLSRESILDDRTLIWFVNFSHCKDVWPSRINS